MKYGWSRYVRWHGDSEKKTYIIRIWSQPWKYWARARLFEIFITYLEKAPGYKYLEQYIDKRSVKFPDEDVRSFPLETQLSLHHWVLFRKGQQPVAEAVVRSRKEWERLKTPGPWEGNRRR